MTIDTQYERLLGRALHYGTVKGDRTGTGTRSLFAQRLSYDLARGFPLITSKRVHFKSIAVELLWMLRGDTNVRWMQDQGVTIWDEWADEDGDLGPVYGRQWRSWPDHRSGRDLDQVQRLIDTIQGNPDDRRQIVSAWNVAELGDMALPPCHLLWQTYVARGRLSLQVYQRSADLFLGVPFNIASYALLTHLLAAQTGLQPGRLPWVGGACHVYLNHVDQVKKQIDRTPRRFPTLTVAHRASIDAYEFGDLTLAGYDPHPPLTAPVAV